MKNRITGLFVATASTALLLSGCGSQDSDLLDEILERGTLIIGTEGTYAPNSYHDESGELVGFDVEVAEKVAEHLGVEAQFLEAEWDSLFAAMDAGRIDLVVNEVEYSEERAEKYDFSKPYTYIRGALMVAQSNNDITGFADLSGKRAAQNLTSSWGQMAESYGAELVSVDSVAQCAELLLSGRVDATLNAETAFYHYMNVNPDAAVKIVAYTDSTISSVIPVPKGNQRLLDAINEALEEMRQTGELRELSEKYFGSDISSSVEMGEEEL
nr:transporter substrate-binding domain-containing protein [uncultured Acetatifactor sp.]